jgi:hypothetical protein
VTALAGPRSLEADFPGWHVWRSSAGRWWATRTGADAAWERGSEVPMTVDADDEDRMREVLTAAGEA